MAIQLHAALRIPPHFPHPSAMFGAISNVFSQNSYADAANQGASNPIGFAGSNGISR